MRDFWSRSRSWSRSHTLWSRSWPWSHYVLVSITSLQDTGVLWLRTCQQLNHSLSAELAERHNTILECIGLVSTKNVLLGRLTHISLRLSTESQYTTQRTVLGPLDRVAELHGRRALRSASSSRLVVPMFRLSIVGSRTFNVSGPQIWNGLPGYVVSAPTFSSFRRRLKPLLFQQSYPDIII